MKSIVVCLIAAFALLYSAPASAAPAAKVTITAKNFSFSPSVVTLKAGQPTTLTFVGAQGVHGLSSPDIGLNQVTITSAGTTVTVTPQKTGTFVAHCAIFCGAGHQHMQIVFKVVK